MTARPATAENATTQDASTEHSTTEDSATQDATTKQAKTKDATADRMPIKLVKPANAYVTSYLAMIEEFRSNGEKVWDVIALQPNETPEHLVARLLKAETEPDEGLVEDTNLWAIDDHQNVVGRISLRHRLNEHLKEFGGHIGYETRPSARRKGVAQQMLEQLLKTAKAKEIGKLMLTCDPSNTVSRKTIEKNGGVLERTRFLEKYQRQTSYYWIAV